eukprot:9674745-Alexandrium_andersonii.AAC.1
MCNGVPCNFLRLPRGLPPPGPSLLPGGIPPPGSPECPRKAPSAQGAGNAFRGGARGAVAPLGSSGGSGGRQQAQETAGNAATHI